VSAGRREFTVTVDREFRDRRGPAALGMAILVYGSVPTRGTESRGPAAASPCVFLFCDQPARVLPRPARCSLSRLRRSCRHEVISLAALLVPSGAPLAIVLTATVRAVW